MRIYGSAFPSPRLFPLGPFGDRTTGITSLSWQPKAATNLIVIPLGAPKMHFLHKLIVVSPFVAWFT
jgi:hypothetical protein